MHQQEALVRIVEIDEAIIGVRNDGIIHVYFRPNTEITVSLQLKLLEVYNEITERKKSLFIFEAGAFCSITKEAREHAIVMEPYTPTLASVVYVQNIGYKLIAEFYYRINRPAQPYKVASRFEDGIKWLQSIAVQKES